MKNLSPAEALKEFHTQVLTILEKHVPLKVKKSRSRSKMHRMRRLLWKRLAKQRRKLKAALTIHKVSECLQNIWKLEAELAADYTSSNNAEEDQAVLRIKSNPKAFYSFVKSRQRVRAKVGPFLDPATGAPTLHQTLQLMRLGISMTVSLLLPALYGVCQTLGTTLDMKKEITASTISILAQMISRRHAQN